jgi:hypothetical protein
MAALKNRLWLALSANYLGTQILALYVRLQDKEIGFVDRHTDIVIEGYPRSGNTFAYVSFLLAQREARNLSVAHHVHGLFQIKYAVQRNIPIMVIIRNPEDAILSLYIRSPAVSMRTLCEDYWTYYTCVKSCLESVFLVDFSAVTSDFPRVLEQFNLRFGTAFDLPYPSESFTAQVQEKVLLMDQRDRGRSRSSHHSVGLPDERRAKQKETLLVRLRSNAKEPLAKCVDLYEELLKRSTS